MKTKPETTLESFKKWYEDWCVKVAKVSYRLKQQDFDKEEGYRKHFKRLIDFYDQSDEYLQCELVFKDLFALRELSAERLDTNKDVLMPNNALLILARQRPTSVAKFDKLFQKFSMGMENDATQLKSLRKLSPQIIQTIVNSLIKYPEEKLKLLEGGRKGGSKKGVGHDDEGRRRQKEERRLSQVNKVKYDNCKILDMNGKHIFLCDEKKALWYIKQGYGDKVADDPLTIQFNF